jgi:hypothetical protein
LNQAIAMVSYYASSSEPAQVRGKTVYLQYSNRQEIVTSKNSGDVASNVLLVTIEGVEAGDVSIDVLHLVSFSYSTKYFTAQNLVNMCGIERSQSECEPVLLPLNLHVRVQVKETQMSGNDR